MMKYGNNQSLVAILQSDLAARCEHLLLRALMSRGVVM